MIGNKRQILPPFSMGLLLKVRVNSQKEIFFPLKVILSFNPLTLGGLLYNSSLVQSFSNSRVSGLVFIITIFIEIPVVNANGVDPDQMLHTVASDLGWQCLPVSLLGISRL